MLTAQSQTLGPYFSRSSSSSVAAALTAAAASATEEEEEEEVVVESKARRKRREEDEEELRNDVVNWIPNAADLQRVKLNPIYFESDGATQNGCLIQVNP